MKHIKKLISVSVLLNMLFVVCVSAGAVEYTVKRVTAQDEIVISGQTEKNELIAVQILPKGLSPEDIQADHEKGGQSVFAKTAESDENGGFSINVQVPKSGEYVAYLRALSDETAVSKPFVFTLAQDKDSAVKSVTEKLNKGENVDTVNYLKDFLCDDETLIGNLERFVDTDVQNAYFSSKMKNRSISDYDDLVLKAKEALILSAAKNSDGPANLKEVMDTYKSVIGVTSLTDKMSVYTAIKGEYADIKAFKAAYDNALNPPSQGSGGGSSGGGGGGGGGSNAKGTYTPSGIGSVQAGTTAAEQTAEPINIKFDDLAAVEWAYKDISELFDKGIINGVSEHLFRPNISVKREEFVKMIVCAMGLQNEEAQSAGFTDVDPGAWYAMYVDIAKKSGISQGMEDNKFGAGAEISRQDMAVMIYNAMKLRGYAPTGQKNEFADRASCADYANEAIAELNAKGIINGVGDDMFDPTSSATRAQSAVIINRALAYLR